MDKKQAEYLAKLETFCAYQERCIYDVEQKMLKLNIESECRKELIDSLIDSGFVDQKRYAISYLRAKVNFKKDGYQKISYALKSKRISDAIIKEAIAEMDTEIYHHNLELIIAKKWNELKSKNEKIPKTKAELKQKLMRYLMGKGYKYDEFKELYAKLD